MPMLTDEVDRLMDDKEYYHQLTAPTSLPARVAGYQRRKMYRAFLQKMAVAPGDTILDVGATSDRLYDHSNYLEAWYPEKTRITAVGVDAGARMVEAVYPGVKFVLADGCALPFASGAFDFVHASAVVEHVGSRQRQAGFLGELWRVARKGVFVTTPNRWFPVEFHTVLPLLHWLPADVFRGILRVRGDRFYSSEDNLNLLSRNTLAVAARAAGIPSFRIAVVTLAGWTTNLLLCARRV